MYGDMRNHANLLMLLLDLPHNFREVVNLKYPPLTQILALPIFGILNFFFDNTLLNAVSSLSIIWILSAILFVIYLNATINFHILKSGISKYRLLAFSVSCFVALSPLALTTSFSEGFLPAYVGIVLVIIYSYYFSRFHNNPVKVLIINTFFLFFMLFAYPLLSVTFIPIVLYYWVKNFVSSGLNLILFISMTLTSAAFLVSYLNYSSWSGAEGAGRFSPILTTFVINILVFFILSFRAETRFTLIFSITSLLNWLLIFYNYYLSNYISYYSLKLSWIWLILQLCLLIILFFRFFSSTSYKIYLVLLLPLWLFIFSSPYRSITSLVRSTDWVPTKATSLQFFNLKPNIPYLYYKNEEMNFRDERIINFWTAVNWKSTPNILSEWAYKLSDSNLTEICKLKKSVPELNIISSKPVSC